MNKGDCDPLAFTTAVNTLAVAIAQKLSEEELTGSLTTIAVQRSLCGKSKEEQTS